MQACYAPEMGGGLKVELMINLASSDEASIKYGAWRYWGE